MRETTQSRAVDSPRDEARRRLEQLLGLSTEQAEQAVAEVLDSMRLDVDEYIRQRHGVLQQQGLSNSEIYERLVEELPLQRFSSPALTARQVRRRVYG